MIKYCNPKFYSPHWQQSLSVNEHGRAAAVNFKGFLSLIFPNNPIEKDNTNNENASKDNLNFTKKII